MADTTIRGIVRELVTLTGNEHIEGEDDTGSFKATLLNSTSGLDAAVIKTKYESNANTNAFLDAEKAKLANIDPNANEYVHPDHGPGGDATSVGDGPITINNGAITNPKIANSAVDQDKIADGSVSNVELTNMPANTIKGRQATIGQAEDLTATQARSLLNVEDGANNYSHAQENHTGDVTSVGLATTIAPGVVDNSKLADNAVSTAKVQDAAITNGKQANMPAETIKLRQTTIGAPQDVRVDALPDDPAPLGTDVLLGQKSGGALVSIQVENLPGGGGGGEANEGVNVGTGSDVYIDKQGIFLRFRTLLAATASSIVITQLADNISFGLDGDSSAPGNNEYYGTDGTGTKGFHALPASVTDHGDLTGLADDDHTQYYNQARGDARYAQVAHTHAAADVTSGTFANARIAQSNVTQHQAALSLTESQITDLGPYADLVHTHVEADITDLKPYVPSDPSGVPSADQITNMMSLTQAQYDGITPNASTLYVIVG